MDLKAPNLQGQAYGKEKSSLDQISGLKEKTKTKSRSKSPPEQEKSHSTQPTATTWGHRPSITHLEVFKSSWLFQKSLAFPMQPPRV